MTKPAITKYGVKGSPLTTSELDTNFQNLRDATINFTDGTNTLSMDLNDTITVEGDPSRNLRVTVSEGSNKITVENDLGEFTHEPMGFENRTDSTISFNASTRVFTIAPVSTSYRIWVQGVMFTKTTTDTITLPNTTGLYYIFFDPNGDLAYDTDYFDFSAEAPISYIYFNSSIPSVPYFADERHGITLDWQTHEYLHRTRGAAYASGFDASNYTTSGDGSSDSHAQIDIANGVFFDEDIKVQITHSNTPTANTWEQDLQGPAQIPVIYRLNGAWELTGPSDYPLVTGTTRVTYNLNTAGVWSIPDASNTYYVSYWIVATHNLNYPVISIMGQAEWNKLSDAQENDTWDSLDLTGFPSLEFRPLYRLIFRTATAYTNTPKAYLADFEDHRLTNILGTVTTGGAEQNAFQNVAVGATTVTADSPTGTLTLAAGTGISLSADSGTDTITITNSFSTVPINTGSISETTSLAIGSGALDSRTGGNGYNTGVGFNALTALTTGDSNVALGTSAGSLVTTGSSNIQIGYITSANTSATGNVLVGYAVRSSGNGNTSLGNYAGTNTSNVGPSGANNTFIGLNAGRLSSQLTGSNNTIIGYNATPSLFSVSNEITLGDANISVFRIPGLKLRVTSGTITTDTTTDLVLNTNTGTNSGTITIANGANQNITIAPNGTGKIVASSQISSSVGAGTAFLDNSGNATSYANAATVDFANFSGMIVVNRQDSSGNVALWILGSGNVLKLGDSTGIAVSGTFSHVSGINGYRWTNDTGGTITVAFAAIKTRNGA